MSIQFFGPDWRAKFQAAADAAIALFGDPLGTSIACVLLDHDGGEDPDPNKAELAHDLLARTSAQRDGRPAEDRDILDTATGGQRGEVDNE